MPPRQQSLSIDDTVRRDRRLGMMRRDQRPAYHPRGQPRSQRRGDGAIRGHTTFGDLPRNGVDQVEEGFVTCCHFLFFERAAGTGAARRQLHIRRGNAGSHCHSNNPVPVDISPSGPSTPARYSNNRFPQSAASSCFFVWILAGRRGVSGVGSSSFIRVNSCASRSGSGSAGKRKDR